VSLWEIGYLSLPPLLPPPPPPPTPPPRREKALVVNLILAGFLVAAVSGVVSVLAAAFVAAVLCVLLGVLRPWEARAAINLNLLVFICGSFGIGIAIAQSGLARQVAALLIQGLQGFGPIGILAGVLLATVVITQLVTNNAAAVMMYPIAIATASQAHLAQRPFVMALLIGASASFLTPIGYQTNMIVHGLGGYRWSDFLRTGLVPLLLLCSVGLAAISIAFPLTPR
jgi:di/tricarboxylate transporter